MFDPDEFLGGPPEKKVPGFDPDAFLGAKPTEPRPAAAEPEESMWQKAKRIAGTAAQPFVDIGKSALAANDFAARALTSPRETFANPGATVREGMRGVNSNIPLANSAVEAFGGPPAESPEDTKAAPGARDFGGVAGMATAGPMLGGIGGAVGEGAIARSAARAPGAVREALKEGGGALVKATERGAIGSVVGSAVGSPALGTAIGVAGQVPTIARSAGTIADEGMAAVARRLMATRGGSVPAAGLAPWESAAAGEVAPAANSQIGALQEALTTATPAQADVIKKAISGIEARGTARGGPNPFDEITQSPEFSQAERAKFIQEMRAAHGGEIRGVTDVPNGAKTATSEEATVAKPAAAEAPPKPKWEPSKADEKFARKMKMPLDEYRAKMGRTFDVPSAAASTPAWSPSSADASFAKQLGMTVDDYRAMMVRRMASQPIAAGP